jgi:urea transport system permease protein
MSPSFVGIVPSIEMVIFCAVGGRTSIFGAIYGALAVNWARTIFSEGLPQLWLFAMGSLFILVVVVFPDGIAGVYRRYADPWLDRLLPASRRRAAPEVKAAATSPNFAE